MSATVQAPVPGEWYWGARCPLCGQQVPLIHDPSGGQPDAKVESPTQGRPFVGLRCVKNHAFDVAVDELERFAYRPEDKPSGRTDGAGHAAGIIRTWPEPSREAAQLVIDRHGAPDEATETHLVWHKRGPWKRIIASRAFHDHHFPAPHIDAVESVIDYRVPPAKFSELAEFDGSVIVERTAGEVSARCHDEEANVLALNLMHDIVTGAKTAREARAYYAKEFADYRRKKPTPYMEKLRFAPDEQSADPDVRMLSDADLDRAVEEGKRRGPDEAG